MIKTENLTINNKQFIRSYSDMNIMIHGVCPEDNYDEAIDPYDNIRTYIETNTPINGQQGVKM